MALQDSSPLHSTVFCQCATASDAQRNFWFNSLESLWRPVKMSK